MSNPPKIIDSAIVLEWAWSGEAPFGVILSPNGEVAVEIYGLAICKYQDSKVIYRFSCNVEWESEQDFDYCSVSDAKENLPEQYKSIEAQWHKYN